jgi:hypothetical protein
MEVITSLIVQTHGIQPALLTSDTGVRSLPTGVFTTGRQSVAYGKPKPSVTPFGQYRCRSPAIPRPFRYSALCTRLLVGRLPNPLLQHAALKRSDMGYWKEEGRDQISKTPTVFEYTNPVQRRRLTPYRELDLEVTDANLTQCLSQNTNIRVPSTTPSSRTAQKWSAGPL